MSAFFISDFIIVSIKLFLSPLQHLTTDKTYDVIIVGGGPAGSICAYTLSQSNLKVLLIEKSEFPRDKICGDAIPSPTHKVLKQFFDEKELNDLSEYAYVPKAELIYDNNRLFSIKWVNTAINIRRKEFDNYLFSKLKDTHIEILQNTIVRSIARHDNSVELIDSNNIKYIAKVIVGADGANSIVKQKLLKDNSNKNIYYGLRQYYSGLDFEHTTNYFFVKKNIPGYFWIFPVGNDIFNVGIGLPLNKNGSNIKSVFQDFINSDAELKSKFKNAKPLENIKGHKLPMGGLNKVISGDNYLLCGDAASLIDPVWGHGIDKALISGNIAAEEIIKAFQHHDFSRSFFDNYNKIIFNKIGKKQKRALIIRNLLLKQLWIIKPLSRVLKLIDRRVS